MNENSKNNITTDESSNNIVIHSGNSCCGQAFL